MFQKMKLKYFFLILICIFVFHPELLARKPNHSVSAIRYIQKSIDARYVGITRMDSLTTIYDIQNKKIVRSFPNFRLIDFAPDEKHYIIQDYLSGGDDSILVKNIETDDLLFKIPFDKKEQVTSVAIFKDMNRVLMGTDDGRLELYDRAQAKTQTIKAPPKKHSSLHPYLQIIISPDETRFCTVTRFSSIDRREWGNRMKEEDPDTYRRWLCYGISIWDTSTMTPIGRYASRFFSGHSSADMSANGKWVIGHTEQGLASLLDAKTAEIIWEPIYNPNPEPGEKYVDVRQMGDTIRFLSEGKYFTTKKEGSLDKIYIWETENKYNKVAEYHCSNFGSNPTGFVSDQKRNLIIIGTSDGAIQVLHFDPSKRWRKITKVWKAPPIEPIDEKWIISHSQKMTNLMNP
jgi:WD40 repeat protein